MKHHQKKIALILSAMRHFAAELRDDGWTVDYVKLDDPDNSGQLRRRGGASGVATGRPCYVSSRAGSGGCSRTWRDGRRCSASRWEILPDDRFVCGILEFADLGTASPRVAHGVLLSRDAQEDRTADGRSEPVGGHGNYDRENRKPPAKGVGYPQAAYASSSTRRRGKFSTWSPAASTGISGRLSRSPFPSRERMRPRLSRISYKPRWRGFGDYQDAMVTGERFLFHAFLSPALNCGLLTPLEVCRAAADAYAAGNVPLNAAEGFIRQIIGWREYMRGMYWLEMPELATANALAATRPLPEFYWTGKTDMLCLQQAVVSTRDEAYAHHIERLMVLGNFAMLAGVHPTAISDWFLVVYADAYEWVEMPNVIAMSQFADGGRLGSKPYAAGGAYINRMSDYCGRCRYDVKQKVGPDACPFNALYWDFLARHDRKLRGNHRMGPVYRNWERMSDEQRGAYRASAAAFLATLEPAAEGWAK